MFQKIKFYLLFFTEMGKKSCMGLVREGCLRILFEFMFQQSRFLNMVSNELAQIMLSKRLVEIH